MPQRVAMKPDPLGVPRNPLAVFLLALAFLSGWMILAGVSTSKGIEQALPHHVVLGWGAMLVFGSGNTLVGMFWQGHETTGLLMKRVGMFTLTVASATYSLVLVSAFGWQGFLSAGITAGFSVSCAIHYKRLNDRVKAILEVSSERARDG